MSTEAGNYDSDKRRGFDEIWGQRGNSYRSEKKLEIFLITRRRVGEKWNRLIIIRRTMAERGDVFEWLLGETERRADWAVGYFDIFDSLKVGHGYETERAK